MTAVAIVDDLGAVLAIAVFDTAEFARARLALAAVVSIALLLMNRSGIRTATPYALLALVLWFAVLQSGVHATIAGVLVALTIPARRLIDAPEFLRRSEIYVAAVAKDLQAGRTEPTEDRRDAIQSLQIAAADLETPLTRLEHALHPWVAFFVVPLFALANAGVALKGDLVGALGTTVTVGVIAGLFLGKQIGIVACSWLAVRSGFATLPDGVGWRQIWGVAILCGIGFTTSLFITTGFAEGPLLNDAKVGILVASLISGVSGALLLARRAQPASCRRREWQSSFADVTKDASEIRKERINDGQRAIRAVSCAVPSRASRPVVGPHGFWSPGADQCQMRSQSHYSGSATYRARR